jgi:cytochrome P450
MQDEQMIAALRRAVGSAFAVKNLLDYEQDVEVTAGILVEKILKIRTIDLFDTLQRFQMDFLLKIAFCESNDFLRNEEEISTMSAQGRLKHWMQWQSMPTLERLLYKPPYLSRFMRSSIPVWAQLARQKLHTRLATMKSGLGHQTDLLQKYIDGGERYKSIINPVIVQNMVSSTISAGFDTTAFTMTTIIYYLLKNPQTFTKLQQELEDAVACGQLSNPPTYAEADKLKYLAAVMKEAMRRYPFLALLLERIVPAGGAMIAGTWLPGGTVVGCHPTIVHHDRDCFGEDADIFRPERWLTDDTERVIAMERASLGFGSGKRVCLGRHIAELEIKKVIPALLLRFKVSGSI